MAWPVSADHTDTICVWTDGLIIKTVAHWQSCQPPHTGNKAADRHYSLGRVPHPACWETALVHKVSGRYCNIA